MWLLQLQLLFNLRYNMQEELDRLERISEDSWYGKGANYYTIQYSLQIFERYMIPGTVLELGPAEGISTDILQNHWPDISVVEGSGIFCERLKSKYPKITVHHCLFEDFCPNIKYDNVVMGHVLEHVQDPVEILKKGKTWVSDRGKIFAAVPNCRSLHRQAGVLLKLIMEENELNPTDIHHGHRRVYCPESFRSDFLKAGLSIQVFGGYWLKPLSNDQIEKTWTKEMLYAFMVLGERYPDIAAENYIVATK